MREPLVRIHVFTFFPSLKFHGFGFYHKIGGLDRAATQALRVNLKASALNLNPPKITSGLGLKTGRLKLDPGQHINSKRGSAEDIAKNIHQLTVMPPDNVMLLLMQEMAEAARTFSNTSNLDLKDTVAPNTPAATTLALLEKGREAEAVFIKRSHDTFTELFKTIQELYYMYLPDEGRTFIVEGKYQMITPEYFNPNTIDIIPHSDPSMSSATQRIMHSDSVVQLAMQMPDIVDRNQAVKDYLVAIGHPHPESVLLAHKNQPILTNVVIENEQLLNGTMPVVFDEQDHVSHIISHVAFLVDISMGSAPTVDEMIRNQIIAHIREHQGKHYRISVAAAIGIPIHPDIPMTPEQEALISMRTAELMQMSPLIHKLEALQQISSEDPTFDMTLKMAQLDYDIKQLEMEDEANARQQKMIDDAQARRDKIATDRQATLIKAQTEATIQEQNHMLKIQTLELEFDKKQDIAVRQAVEEEQRKNREHMQEMRQNHEEHIQELKQEHEKHVQEMRQEHQKAVIELEKDKAKLETEKEMMEQKKKKGLFGMGGDSK